MRGAALLLCCVVLALMAPSESKMWNAVANTAKKVASAATGFQKSKPAPTPPPPTAGVTMANQQAAVGVTVANLNANMLTFNNYALVNEYCTSSLTAMSGWIGNSSEADLFVTGQSQSSSGGSCAERQIMKLDGEQECTGSCTDNCVCTDQVKHKLAVYNTADSPSRKCTVVRSVGSHAIDFDGNGVLQSPKLQYKFLKLSVCKERRLKSDGSSPCADNVLNFLTINPSILSGLSILPLTSDTSNDTPQQELGEAYRFINKRSSTGIRRRRTSNVVSQATAVVNAMNKVATSPAPAAASPTPPAASASQTSATESSACSSSTSVTVEGDDAQPMVSCCVVRKVLLTCAVESGPANSRTTEDCSVSDDQGLNIGAILSAQLA